MLRVERVLPQSSARWFALTAVGLLCAGSLVAGVAIVSMGPGEFKSFSVAWLDDHHIRGPRTELVRATRHLQRANPAEDAHTAVASGDSRLIPVAGVGAVLPGLPDELLTDYQRRYGFKEPLYAGCVVNSAEESQFRDAAFAYATEYNQTVVAQVKQ